MADPFGLFDQFSALSAAELGALAQEWLAPCLVGRGVIWQRHLLDLVGLALRAREPRE